MPYTPYTRHKGGVKNFEAPKSGKRFLKFFLIFFVSILSLLFLAGGITYFIFSRELPRLFSINDYTPNTITKVFSGDGETVAEYYIERRIVVSMSSIPDHVVKAFLAAEDAKFFDHKGINLKRILAALLKNIQAKRVVQGGSTITQQVVKNILLTPERNLTRKIKEAILALRIERNFSKEEILHIYLNHIYLGNGAYGIQAASENYFDKDVGELTLSEATMLAGLPRAPIRYSPYAHPERALRRQKYVLNQMVKSGFISADEAREAIETPVVLKSKGIKSLNAAPYFTEHVRRYVEEKYGYDTLYKGGLQIYTTMDLTAQKIAQESIKYGLKGYDQRHGYRGPIKTLAGKNKIDGFNSEVEKELSENPLEAGEDKTYRGVVTRVDLKGGYYNVRLGKEKGRIAFEEIKWEKRVFDTENDTVRTLDKTEERDVKKFLKAGDVVELTIKSLEKDDKGFLPMTLKQEPEVQAALISIDPFTGEVKAMVGGSDFSKSQFNRATQARRQPGSAFKPVIYAAALDRGYTPASIIIDSPVIYEEEVEKGKKKDGEDEIKVWKPRNFDKRFHGPTTFRDAIARSRNLVTIKILKDIKLGYTVDYARKLGIESPLNRDLSLALGSSGVSLLELTKVYSVFAAAGKKINPVFITRILDRDGNVVEENLPEIEEVISPETAFIMTSLLRGVIERGTGRKAKAIQRPAAAKTGTTNDYVDAWFVGYIPDLVTGVWIGYDNEKTLGKLETGSRAALPVWLKYMKSVSEGRPPRSFAVPEGVVFAKIDPDTGYLAPPGMKGAVFEAFKVGTTPEEITMEASNLSSGKFFELDQ